MMLESSTELPIDLRYLNAEELGCKLITFIDEKEEDRTFDYLDVFDDISLRRSSLPSTNRRMRAP
ncbi:hypothetical protein M514_04801 [Trichuris suis]|uniref:Uncharacterized protein n=1 Tax=Trichuris suis TaxID=68888 RepID=A0A085MAL3_9BILA|nr:hypothetical protein M513_04801 [Trichuris suis]KFD73187.1 hypothetical protein M514_04801 [Trichuris suis]